MATNDKNSKKPNVFDWEITDIYEKKCDLDSMFSDSDEYSDDCKEDNANNSDIIGDNTIVIDYSYKIYVNEYIWYKDSMTILISYKHSIYVNGYNNKINFSQIEYTHDERKDTNGRECVVLRCEDAGNYQCGRTSIIPIAVFDPIYKICEEVKKMRKKGKTEREISTILYDKYVKSNV